MKVLLCKYFIQIYLIFQSYSFAREDEGSPRQDILAEFCPAPLKNFRTCMTANDFKEDLCLESKGILDKCAGSAFKQINGDPNRTFG